MITYNQALKHILKNTSALPAEKVLTEDSVGRILREDIYSKIEMPPFDKAAMDGYAVNASDTQSAPIKLKCAGLIQAGEGFKKKVRHGECVKIMTGAPLPKNTDAVIMIEDTRECKEGVEILKYVKKGENVCFKGEDIKQGEKVLAKDMAISYSDVAILATVGRRFVKASTKPRVVILNTGGEIVPVGAKLTKNKIYNSNGPMLYSFLKSDCIEPEFAGIIRDNNKELKKAIRKGLDADVLLISGGVSMGDYDLIPDILSSLGVKKIFHKVNIKPGKPLFFGVKNKTLIFGIPGNPVSNFLTYLIFIRPALYKMMGYKDCRGVFKEGIVKRGLRLKSSRRHFILVKITIKGNRYYLNPIPSHGSADTLSLSSSDGFMMVDKDSGIIGNNTRMPFITWKTLLPRQRNSY